MAKGWKKIADNSISDGIVTRAERVAKDKAMSNLVRNTKTLKAFDLKKESEELYEKAKAEEDKLLDAFDRKVVKSKNAIKQAIRIKKERAEAAKNKEPEAAKTIENEPVTEA